MTLSRRAFAAAAASLFLTATARAQSFVPIPPEDIPYPDGEYYEPEYDNGYRRPRYVEPQYEQPRRQACRGNPDGRYCVPRPQNLPYNGTANPGTIIIDTGNTALYLVLSRDTVRRYTNAVGRQGDEMQPGQYKVYRRAEWPDWYPTENMRLKRNLPKVVRGGPNNPLGSRALYLATLENKDDLYRIHGTNEPQSIGKQASSGCFRMLNEDVEELYQLVPDQARVHVTAQSRLSAIPRYAPQ